MPSLNPRQFFHGTTQKFEPEMFDSDQYADSGYLEDRRYRTHW